MKKKLHELWKELAFPLAAVAAAFILGGLLMLAAGAVLLLLRARQCRKNPVFGKQEAQKAVS